MTARIVGAPAGAVGRLDLISGPDRLELLVDVPGLAREDLDVTVDGRHVVVAGHPEQGAESRRFERRLIFDADIAADDVAASLADGVLRITLPRRAQVTRVPVQGPTHRRLHAGERLRRPLDRIRVRRGHDLRRSLRRLAARRAAA